MTRKQRRLAFVAAGLVTLGAATALVLSAFEENIVFFYSPTDLVTREVPLDRRLRIGGLVEGESVERLPDGALRFVVTDTANSIPVHYHGIVPDLFREGQGVVAEGRFDGARLFLADTVLARHDEAYMPPEAAEALKRAGIWKHMEAQK
jgi:cytochrome c-type biogenesis protein CcmE